MPLSNSAEHPSYHKIIVEIKDEKNVSPGGRKEKTVHS